jgi:hypothetical protein
VPPDAVIEFKITRGNWATVEKGVGGEEISNRRITVRDSRRLTVRVARWPDRPERPLAGAVRRDPTGRGTRPPVAADPQHAYHRLRVKIHNDQPYVKISPSAKAGTDSGVPEGLAVYYAASGEVLALTLNEQVLQRALDRQAGRTEQEVAIGKASFV